MADGTGDRALGAWWPGIQCAVVSSYGDATGSAGCGGPGAQARRPRRLRPRPGPADPLGRAAPAVGQDPGGPARQRRLRPQPAHPHASRWPRSVASSARRSAVTPTSSTPPAWPTTSAPAVRPQRRGGAGRDRRATSAASRATRRRCGCSPVWSPSGPTPTAAPPASTSPAPAWTPRTKYPWVRGDGPLGDQEVRRLRRGPRRSSSGSGEGAPPGRAACLEAAGHGLGRRRRLLRARRRGRDRLGPIDLRVLRSTRRGRRRGRGRRRALRRRTSGADELAAALDRLLASGGDPAAYDGSRADLAALKDMTSRLIGRFVAAVEDATRRGTATGR